eukprot:CAMPEP_0174229966 /NCGR_PEP_ID=MMETSP0417-20130205/821_1 /TAXON_ID=242541 /ORGANISM="Mayorella sp, Strain BSH-02190019" /LENGTH=301 /DNA_ID=CAMNT_0015307577 /DNA_START=130 /DNA_END=1035 /DNA_ORIENTATION=+
MGCCTSISQSTIGVKEKWGRYDSMLHPGLHFLIPCCGDAVVARVNLRTQQLSIRVESISADKVSVTIGVAVQYVIQNDDDQIHRAYYKLDDAKAQITSYVEDVVRQVIPSLTLDKVFETKQEIAQAVGERLSEQLSEYGYTIMHSLVTDILPAKEVVASMNRINAAERERVAAENQGEARKILAIKAAEADAESKFLSGEGIARQRQAIIKGLESSVSEFTDTFQGINPQEVMNMILITQYFDTLSDIGTGSSAQTIFVPHSPGSISDLYQQLTNSMVAGGAANTFNDTVRRRPAVASPKE